jgi:hypothetical protein
MVSPGADGVEVGQEGDGEVGGEGFAVELGGEAGGEILGHDEGDEEGVAGEPGAGVVVEEMELYRQDLRGRRAIFGAGRRAYERVDAVGVCLELVKLVRRKEGGGAVSGGPELKVALLAVVRNEGGAEEFGELAGTVTAEGVHLKEAVGSCDVALGEEEVVEVGGVDAGDAMGVAGDGDRGGEAGDGEVAVELGEGGSEVVAEVDGGGDGGDDEEQEQHGRGDEEASEPEAAGGGLGEGHR